VEAVVPVTDHFEVIVEPEPPDDRMVDAEETNRQTDGEAREMARAAFINAKIVGSSHQSPAELEHWPKRFQAAYLDELRRLGGA
jgi:hypothetical protein